MPKTIETTVYQFDELNERAKDKARDWYRGIASYNASELCYEFLTADSERIGLRIDRISDTRANEGAFVHNPSFTINAIVETHGKECTTYKTALEYRAKFYDLDKSGLQDHEADKYEDEYNELSEEFLTLLLEDYRIMYEKDLEYHNSNEYIDEILRMNEYTFTETGERLG